MKQFNNLLHIDTRDNQKIVIRLKTKNKEFIEESVANIEKAQATLPLVEKVLGKAGLKVKDIDEIKVETGPGSFTGLRVGISIANALGFASNIKINGKRVGEIEVPKY